MYTSDRNTRSKASKIGAPPPTAQTPGPIWLIFRRETPHVNTFRRTEAILAFYRGSRDMDTFGGFGGVQLGFKNCLFLAHISALNMKLQNPHGASESIHMRGLSPKNEPIRLRRMGCRWGCSVFEAFHLVYRSLLYRIYNAASR